MCKCSSSLNSRLQPLCFMSINLFKGYSNIKSSQHHQLDRPPDQLSLSRGNWLKSTLCSSQCEGQGCRTRVQEQQNNSTTPSTPDKPTETPRLEIPLASREHTPASLKAFPQGLELKEPPPNQQDPQRTHISKTATHSYAPFVPPFSASHESSATRSGLSSSDPAPTSRSPRKRLSAHMPARPHAHMPANPRRSQPDLLHHAHIEHQAGHRHEWLKTFSPRFPLAKIRLELLGRAACREGMGSRGPLLRDAQFILESLETSVEVELSLRELDELWTSG